MGVHLCERMSTSANADQLRASAVHLRVLAGKIGASRALTVHSLAGPDTWVGPTPQSCLDALLAVRRQLQSEQQALVDTARAYERRANELERLTPFSKLVS